MLLLLQVRQGDSPATFFRTLFSSCRVLSAAAAAALSQQLAAGTALRAQPDSLATSAGDAAAADLASQWELAAESGTAAPVGESRRQQEAGIAAAAAEQLVALGLSFEPESAGSTESEQQESLQPQQEESPQPQQDRVPVADAPPSDEVLAAGSIIDVQPQPSSSTSGSSFNGSSGSVGSSNSTSSSAGAAHSSSHTADGGGQSAAAAARRAVASTLPPGAS